MTNFYLANTRTVMRCTDIFGGNISCDGQGGCVTAPDELILSGYCGASAQAEQQIMDRGGDVSYDASEMSKVANPTFASSAHMQLANLDP